MAQTEGWSDWFPVVSDSGYAPSQEAAALDVPKRHAQLIALCGAKLGLRRALRPRIKITFKGKCK